MKVMMADAREAKLPVWAQDALRDLRREVANLINLVGDLKGAAPADSRIVGVTLGTGAIDEAQVRHRLPWDSIEFVMYEDERRASLISARVRQRIGVRPAVELMGHTGTLIVRPSASNVVTVELEA